MLKDFRAREHAVRLRKVPAWLSSSLVVGAFGLLWLLERQRPLRRSVEPKLRHTGRNVALGGLAAASLQLLERPLIQPLTTLIEKRKLGLLSPCACQLVGSDSGRHSYGLQLVPMACAYAPSTFSLALSSPTPR